MEIRSISARDAHDLLNAGGGVALDVRTDGEYLMGHIPHAQHIPLDALSTESKDHRIDPEKDIIVYCASGNRSRIACEILAKRGYARCYNLSGGIGAWRVHDLPIE